MDGLTTPPRRRSALAGNPALVGAVTVLVSIVSVFLAYNATEGLPFAPTYDLEVELPDALNLIHGNEIKLGGNRVGIVRDVEPGRAPDGAPVAVAQISLQPELEELPVDSTWVVRPRSPFGLKYLELTPGSSSRTLAPGAKVPSSQITPDAVDWAHFQDMFDARTRRGAQRSLEGFGDALAGRGRSINAVIVQLGPLLAKLEPVASSLASRRAGLRRFFPALARFARELAPVGEQQARLFVALDGTFTALAGVARPHLQRFWEAQPPLYDVGVREIPRLRTFLGNVSGFWRELQPGAEAIVNAAPELASATTDGLRHLPAVPAVNRDLESLLLELRDFAEDPVVLRGIRSLQGTVRELDSSLPFLVPAQTRCNYLTVFFRNFASLLSEGYSNGTWGRAVVVVAPTGPNNEGSLSPVPADGPEIENHLHANPYPNTAAPGQPRECEGGNEDYFVGRTHIGGIPGNQGLEVDTRTRQPIEFFGGGFEEEP